MMCYNNPYDELKALLQQQTEVTFNLHKLKNIFAQEIGSVRRLESIRSVRDLIDILERRDVLSEYNIEVLREIADNSENQKLQDAVAAYVTPKYISDVDPVNRYQEQRLADEVRHTLNISVIRSSQNAVPVSKNCTATPLSTVPFDEKKRAAVYKLLSRNIGTYWRFMGRELNVGEGDMDAIELQFPTDLSSRVYKLMQLFEEDESNNESQRILNICRALDECGRKDLRRKVEQIMSN